MACTRLRLDWSINDEVGRAEFVQRYINEIKFNLTAEEKETIANYMLWGQDTEGKNADQRGEIELERTHSSWKKQSANVESLDELLENPTWNENEVVKFSTPRTKQVREVFSRAEARQNAPKYLLPTFESLWKQIDEIEFIINKYDLLHNTRKNPPREELLNRIAPARQQELETTAAELGQKKYLTLRHLLVELRKEQYTIKDTYSTKIQKHSVNDPIEAELPELNVEYPIYPLGLYNELFFKEFTSLSPDLYDEKELKEISKIYWNKKNFHPDKNSLWFDFRELEHVYNLLINGIGEGTLLEKTLKYYTDNAILTDAQREILLLKIKKVKNVDIAEKVNEKFNKSYTTNYISTIFRQKIIPKINEAARQHEEIVGNLFFPEEFKKCSCCGKTYLLSPENFVRKSKSKSGYSSRCKNCDRLKRKQYTES